jgi:RHS repeat-associated protein
VDHLGTSQRLTNAQGETTWRMVSEAFGKTFVDTTLAPTTTGTTTNNLRFPGQYEDVETATHYNYMRTYLPMVGRYVESDPIGLAGGPSTYAYVLNDPMQLVDRDGKLPSLPQPFVDVVVGFGDGASIGLTRLYRDWRNIGSVDTCSASYAVGNLASLALGLTRVAYAGAVAASAASASSGVAASAARSALRRRFGGGDSFRPPNLARYADDAELRLAAGRTNPGANAWGAGAAGAGAAGASGCGCK